MIRFAHQFGWDEILWFAAPALIGWLALRSANKRATAAEAAAKERKRQADADEAATADEALDD